MLPGHRSSQLAPGLDAQCRADLNLPMAAALADFVLTSWLLSCSVDEFSKCGLFPQAFVLYTPAWSLDPQFTSAAEELV